MKKLIILVVLAVFAENAFAQSFYNRRIDRKWVASAGTGTAKYFGELTNDGDIIQGTLYNIEVGLERRFTDRISARGNLTFFQIQSSDIDAKDESRVRRNLSFKGANIELSATGIIQLFSEVGRYYQRPVINPYFFLGLGALYYNPRAEIPATYHDGSPIPEAGKMTSLRQYKTEFVNYSPVTLVIPFGVGVKMMIAPPLNVSINGGYRYTLSDYLDDMSTVHFDDADFGDPLAAALSDRRPELGLEPYAAGKKRGNPDKKDGYFLFSIRIDYYLPPQLFGSGNRANSYNKRRKAPKRREP